MKKFLTTVLGMCLLAGCQASTSQRVGVATESYITATSSMTVLARSGNLDVEDAETFESFRAPAKEYLDTALEDLLDGDDSTSTADNAVDILIPILDRMIEASKEAHRE